MDANQKQGVFDFLSKKRALPPVTFGNSYEVLW